jgi:hypothetical protein
MAEIMAPRILRIFADGCLMSRRVRGKQTATSKAALPPPGVPVK